MTIPRQPRIRAMNIPFDERPSDQLVTFSPEKRQQINEFRGDPDAWISAESQANTRMRVAIIELTMVLRTAQAHPHDPECAELLAVIREIYER